MGAIATSKGLVNSVGQLITVILIFILVLAITYFTTKWIAGYQRKNYITKNVQVVETFRLSNSKYLQIIKAGGKCLLIAVSKDNVTMLTELDPDSVTEFVPEQAQTSKVAEGFGSILEKAKNMKPKK